jgi:hypothetical protein
MAFPIIGGSQSGGYQIDNSLRFNRDDTPYLSKTFSAGNRRTFTYSAWLKLGSTNSGTLFGAWTDDPNRLRIATNGSDKLLIFGKDGGTNNINLTSTLVVRDVSAWYHVFVAFDTTQATASNRIKLYLNGVQVTSFTTETYPAQNYETVINNATGHYIGQRGDGSSDRLGGYLAEAHFIDGTAKAHTDFGEFDEDSGVWKPKQYTGSYGTNGFYLDFSNSGTLGEDFSGNDNDFSSSNLASTDQTTDTPTNNFATLNAVDFNGGALEQGNLKQNNSGACNTNGTIGMPTGKWYWEICINSVSGGVIGVGSGSAELGTALSNLQKIYGYAPDGNKYENSSASSYGASYTTGDIIGVKFDADTRQLEFLKNNSSQGVAFTVDSGYLYLPQIHLNNTDITINFGQEGSFAGSKTAQGNADGNGYGDFYYAPPSGYLALCTQNLATALSPTIDDGSQYFDTTTYTGNSSTLAITSLNFQPDFLWIKRRSSSSTHALFNSTVGRDKSLGSESNDAEFTSPSDKDLISFDSNGFTVAQPNQRNVNGSSQTFVGWSWKANGGTTSSNTDGSITSTVQANTTAGFSIVTYTGTGSSSTAGHGLNSTPEVIISKGRNATQDWAVHTTIIDGSMDFLVLNNTNAKSDSSFSLPTSTVFPTRTNNDYVAYIFHSVEGYSKFGSYTGNGNADGTFVYTGFRPAFIITKKTDGAYNWGMLDATRSSFNLADDWLGANLSNAESVETTRSADLLSNGFKARGTNGDINHDSPYLYMAFAENPFVTSGGVPVTAR